MAIQNKITFFIMSLLFSLGEISQAEFKTGFPFELKFTGELVNGYFFYDIHYGSADNEEIEVMITKHENLVAFPGNVHMSLPLLQDLYRKMENKGTGSDAALKLARLLTPLSAYQMEIYPDFEKELLDRSAVYLNLDPQDLVKSLKKIRELWLKQIDRPLKKGEFNIAILAGRKIREYLIQISDNSQELIKIEETRTSNIQTGKTEGSENLLPEIIK